MSNNAKIFKWWCIFALIAYCLGSFIFASFDLSVWHSGVKGFMAFIWFIVAFVVVLYYK